MPILHDQVPTFLSKTISLHWMNKTTGAEGKKKKKNKTMGDYRGKLKSKAHAMSSRRT